MKRLSDEEYKAKLKAQGGGCAICGRKPKKGGRRFCQDHNHQTGKLRGLLCFICNGKILGRLERFRHYATLIQVSWYLREYDPDNQLLKVPERSHEQHMRMIRAELKADARIA